jgi:hypothetical protein
MEKKINFILFAIFFSVLVIWTGVWAWNSLTTQKDPTNPPSSADEKPLNLLNDIEENTGIDFSEIENRSFEWSFVDGEVLQLSIEGKSFEAKKITNENYNKVDSYFKEKEFEVDVTNSASATFSGVKGYKRGSMVCLVEGGYSGYESADESWNPKENNNDIKVICGKL